MVSLNTTKMSEVSGDIQKKSDFCWILISAPTIYKNPVYGITMAYYDFSNDLGSVLVYINFLLFQYLSPRLLCHLRSLP